MIATVSDLAQRAWPFFGVVLAVWLFPLLWLQRPRASRDSWIGIGCYVASFFLSTAYLGFSERPTAILVWQLGMIAVMVMYASAIFLQRDNPDEPIPGIYLVAAVAYAAFGLWINGGLPPLAEPEEQRRGYELFGFMLISCLPWIVLRGVRQDDLLGVMIWTGVGIAETVAVIEYLDCAILAPDIWNLDQRWGIDVPKMACAREYGWIYQPAVQALQVLLLSCILTVHFCRHKLPDIVKRFTAQ